MIYLQKYAENGLGREEKAILQYLILESIPYRFASLDEPGCQFKSKIDNCEMFVGSVEGVTKILEVLGYASPIPNYYPACLHQFLKRKVWSGRISDVKLFLQDGALFIKPFDEWKTFTGSIITPQNSNLFIDKYPADMKIWFSEVVNYVSEFRVYVTEGKCTAICQYSGEEDSVIETEEILEAITIMNLDDSQKKTYAFDWGLTEDGKVSLVELNGSFAIGKYSGITNRQYFSFLMSGWKQLVQ